MWNESCAVHQSMTFLLCRLQEGITLLHPSRRPALLVQVLLLCLRMI